MRLITGFLLSLAVLAAPLAAQRPAKKPAPPPPEPTAAVPQEGATAEKLVLAHCYNGWYEAGQQHGQGELEPQIGWYDGGSPQTVKWQIEQAKRAGVDGFILSWWTWGGGKQARAAQSLLAEAERQGFKITAQIEDTGGDLERVLGKMRRSLAHPAWLQIDGKPAVFVYGRVLQEIDPAEFKPYNDRVFFVLESFQEKVLRGAGGTVGAHVYNPLLADPPEDPRKKRRAAIYKRISAAKEKNPQFFWCATVVPEWRFEKEDVMQYPGNGLQLYDRMWELALATNADCIIVNSWNERGEWSGIEPSKRYGDSRVVRTRFWVDKWKAGTQ